MNPSHDTSPRPFLIEIPLRVHGYDIDLAGIVSNLVYVRWLEDLRMAFCEAHYPVEAMMARGFLPALTSTHIEYKRAIRFGDRVLGRIWFERFRGQRWHFRFEIVANDQIAAEARQAGISINLTDQSIRPIPEDMIERFRPGAAAPESI